jgi:NAD(P)-dependent dehydrogenase (short-subunit alcohol dehydrogenase family)
MAGLASVDEVVVTRDGGGVAEALVELLRGKQLKARVADEVDGSADAVIFLGGLREPHGDDEAIEISREAFRAAKAFAPHATESGGVFVTVQDTGGDFGLSGSERAWLGGIAGLAKTAALEWSQASVKAIDLERGGRSALALAEAIAAELYLGGAEMEVGLHVDGRRTTLQSKLDAARATREPSIDEHSVLVCSGGARGVTAATLLALAKQYKPRVVLLGRTAVDDEPAVCAGIDDDAGLKRALLMAAKTEGRPVKPAELGAQVRRILAVREIRGTLASLEAAGSPARYLSTDVSNTDDVRSALAEVRREWGPITGIIHGAGVVADKLIGDKTPDQFERVLRTKVGGIRALFEATSDDPLSLLVMFSSVAARTGNVGQCDYAVANEMLNKIAARYAREHQGCVVKSLNWGPWEGGMVTPALRRYFTEHGVALIPLEVGARMMLEELADESHIEVVLGGAPRRASIADAGSGDDPAGNRAETRFAVHVDSDSYPYLIDHSIENVPVLPVVLALEWFARAAVALCPGLAVAACRNVRLFRGVPLPQFEDGGHWLALRCNKRGEREVEVELCSPADSRIRYYAAVVELVEPEALASLAMQNESAPLSPADMEPLGVPIYGDALFHGPQFHVIRDVLGVGAQGIAGELVGTEAQQWVGGPWHTDPALLDGGLQLALLWAQKRLGGHSLPTGLAAYRSFSAEPVEGPLRCMVSAEVVGGAAAVSDISFIDRNGRLVSRLEGVETHQRS